MIPQTRIHEHTYGGLKGEVGFRRGLESKTNACKVVLMLCIQKTTAATRKPKYASLNHSIAGIAVVVFLGRRLYLTPSQTIPTLVRLSTHCTPGEAAPRSDAISAAPPFRCHQRCSYSTDMAVVMVELLEYPFRLFVFHLDRRHGRFDFLQQYRIFPIRRLSGIVFVCAVMLNLLAGIFYFGHA